MIKKERQHVVIGIGCTGGQHRSVSLTNYFADHYSQSIMFIVYIGMLFINEVSFARQVKEEVVFNDFDICCQKAIYQQLLSQWNTFFIKSRFITYNKNRKCKNSI